LFTLGRTPSHSKRAADFRLTAFQESPKLLHVISGSGSILGLTVLGSELFVVRNSAARGEVEVYNTNTFTLTRELNIRGSESLWAIVACSHNNCLYISDDGLKIIYRFDLQSNKVMNNWSVGGRCYGLSVTRSCTVLVTSFDAKRIKEYKPDGILLREISLDVSIVRPYHCVQLSSEQFVVSHGGWGTEESRLCIVDVDGLIIQSYGGPSGSEPGQMHGPHHMVVDKHGHVMVADCGNDRVEILSPTLDHLGYVVVPGHILEGPHAVHIDALNHRLYIGEYDGRRLFVLDADLSSR